MFGNPSLITRIAVGKIIGFAFGLVGLIFLPHFLPDIGWMPRLGILFWYTTVGAMIGVFGVVTWHPVFRLPMPWWFRAPVLGGWMNFVEVQVLRFFLLFLEKNDEAPESLGVEAVVFFHPRTSERGGALAPRRTHTHNAQQRTTMASSLRSLLRPAARLSLQRPAAATSVATQTKAVLAAPRTAEVAPTNVATASVGPSKTASPAPPTAAPAQPTAVMTSAIPARCAPV